MSLQITLDSWLNSNSNFASQTQQFVNLTEQLGYRDLHEFFDDNSGCIDACYTWIGKQRCDEWEQALTPTLREDIQNLLDNGFIELEQGIDEQRYIGISTRNVILIEDNSGARHLVGSIEVDCDLVIFYDEADKEIKNTGDNWVYGYELK